MALTDYATLLDKLSRPLRVGVDKLSNTAGNESGSWGSQWSLVGSRWTAGATPSTASGETLSSSSLGALPLPVVPAGENLYLVGIVGTISDLSPTDQSLCLYDRLVQTGALSGVVTTTQVVNSIALSRFTSGEGVFPYIEIYTVLGTTAVTGTITYVNQAGVTKTTSITVGGTGFRSAGVMIRIPLAEGDTGVRSITDITLSASTGTAGAFGFTLIKPLVIVEMYSDTTVTLDWADLGIPLISSDACITAWSANTGERLTLAGDLQFITA